jgi:hypothetical protein
MDEAGSIGVALTVHEERVVNQHIVMTDETVQQTSVLFSQVNLNQENKHFLNKKRIF